MRSRDAIAGAGVLRDLHSSALLHILFINVIQPALAYYHLLAIQDLHLVIGIPYNE